MTKLSKRDYVNLAILVMVFLAIVAVLTRLKYGYGSTTDWQQQHWVLPEYFRNLFYENHEVFPSFAFNIGGGQNIFNFSYYGLYSPIILLSYLFPFVDMLDYIVITSILTVISSVVIFYIWLRRNNYNSKICFLVSFIFLCASPLIFQSH
ncbi:MAG TPA: YfhO family protein, partial [Clostridiales bacterium]|nr:YfhO family protein [Clostridiales bacterium]